MLFLLENVSSDQIDRIFFVKTKILMMLIRLTLLSNFRRNLFALACTYEASSMSLWDNAEKKITYLLLKTIVSPQKYVMVTKSKCKLPFSEIKVS